MSQVDIEDYLAQEQRYGGFWSRVNFFFEAQPQVFTRIRPLHEAGYRYIPPEEYAPPKESPSATAGSSP
jgi:hypothetical protein